MRICYVLDRPFAGLGGAERVASITVRNILQLGHEVVMVQFTDGAREVPLEASGFSVRSHYPAGMPALNLYPLSRNVVSNALRTALSIWDPIGEHSLTKVVEDVNPDLIHFECVQFVGAGRALASYGVPLVMRFPGYAFMCPKGGLQRRSGQAAGRECPGPPLACQLRNCLLRATVPQPDAIIAQSHFVGSLLVAQGYPSEIVRYIPNPVVMPDTLPSRLDFPPKRLIFAGRLAPEKGVADVIRAVADLADSEVELVIAGDGPDRSSLEALARQLGASVRFVGRLSADQLTEAYLTAAAAVVPSRSRESFCLSAAEAMGHGLPVIASDIGALPELVIPGVTGYLFPPGDTAALRNCMMAILSDPAAAKRMGCAARDRAQDWTVAKHRERIGALYVEVMGRRRLPVQRIGHGKLSNQALR